MHTPVRPCRDTSSSDAEVKDTYCVVIPVGSVVLIYLQMVSLPQCLRAFTRQKSMVENEGKNGPLTLLNS